MTNMNESAPIDKLDLFMQLENYKLITAINEDLFLNHLGAKGLLALEFERAENCLGELEVWEQKGENTKCIYAMAEAKAILKSIRALLDEVLTQ